MTSNPASPDNFVEQARAFMQAQKTMSLSSVDAGGAPHISYAPYLHHTDGCFYIYISQLAAHHETINLGAVSAMIIRDENQSSNLFARMRITFDCAVTKIDKSSHAETEILDLFAKRQGKVVSLLRALPDFSLMQLQPKTALFVKGFGDAHHLDDALHLLVPTDAL
ncbi:MAG: putative heme iron utilization protein [Saprospiraceae bacterium]|jgi:putative heme iron utilization protein